MKNPNKIIKHKPSTWEKITGIRIIDPDGWRNDNKSWNTPLTEEEWTNRMYWSTIYNIQQAIKQGAKFRKS